MTADHHDRANLFQALYRVTAQGPWPQFGG